jgi:hypothetical protein
MFDQVSGAKRTISLINRPRSGRIFGGICQAFLGDFRKNNKIYVRIEIRIKIAQTVDFSGLERLS